MRAVRVSAVVLAAVAATTPLAEAQSAAPPPITFRTDVVPPPDPQAPQPRATGPVEWVPGALVTDDRSNAQWRLGLAASTRVPAGFTLSAGVVARRGERAPAYVTQPIFTTALSPTPTLWDTNLAIARSFAVGHASLRVAGELFNPFTSATQADPANVSRTLTSRSFRVSLTLAF